MYKLMAIIREKYLPFIETRSFPFVLLLRMVVRSLVQIRRNDSTPNLNRDLNLYLASEISKEKERTKYQSFYPSSF